MVVVTVGEDVVATANLVGAVESAGVAASKALIDGSVVKGWSTILVGKAALLVVSQELVSTALVLVVFKAENGVNATKIGGGVE